MLQRPIVKKSYFISTENAKKMGGVGVLTQTRLSFAHCEVCWPSAGVVALACVLAERQIVFWDNLKNSKFDLYNIKRRFAKMDTRELSKVQRETELSVKQVKDALTNLS